MRGRLFNFNPGPSALPQKVLEKVQAELMNYRENGLSVMEMSHRSPSFDDIIDTAIARLRRMLKLPDHYSVLFLQGGASMQFAMVPMNLCLQKKPAYINTGTWSIKAINEANIQGLNPIVVASSEDKDFTYIPADVEVPDAIDFLHVTSNNTIKGTQWHAWPVCNAPLVVDMSSDILSRPMDILPCGMVYAGAQKNLGPSGVTLVIIREDMLDRVPEDLPTMFRYTTYAQKNSLYNTPPTFAIYVVGLVLQWLEEDMGGLEEIERYNQKKAKVLYDFIDQADGFYRATAKKDSRSLMNVTFRLKDQDLEDQFVKEGLENGLGGLKGHKSVGGCRASIYNAVPQEAVTALVDFMADFMKRYG